MPKTSPKRLQLEALTNRQNDALRRVFDTLALKRRNPKLSLSAAAKQSGTTLRTVRNYASPTLEIRSGRLDVKASDRLPRQLRMLVPRGEVVVSTTSSRTASRIAKYNNAIRQYLVTGDPAALKPFVGKSIRSGGKTYELLTDTRTINRLARAGAVHFADIYATVGKS